MICTTKWILQRTDYSEKVPIDSTLGLKQRYNPVVPFGLYFQFGVRLMITPVWKSNVLIIEKVPEPYTNVKTSRN